MTKDAKAPLEALRGARPWPLSVAAYHVLSEAGVTPKNVELLHGFIYQKLAKSPYHCFLLARLLRFMQPAIPDSYLLRSEQPITCLKSEPEPDISIVRGTELDFR